jgi:hypothetical protein
MKRERKLFLALALTLYVGGVVGCLLVDFSFLVVFFFIGWGVLLRDDFNEERRKRIEVEAQLAQIISAIERGKIITVTRGGGTRACHIFN